MQPHCSEPYVSMHGAILRRLGMTANVENLNSPYIVMVTKGIKGKSRKFVKLMRREPYNSQYIAGKKRDLLIC